MVEEGLRQRVTALDRFLDDLYLGEQAVLEDRVVPSWLLLGDGGSTREQ